MYELTDRLNDTTTKPECVLANDCVDKCPGFYKCPLGCNYTVMAKDCLLPTADDIILHLPSEEMRSVYDELKDIKDNIKYIVDNKLGEQMLLCGGAGTGKTSWAIKILREFIGRTCMTNRSRSDIVYDCLFLDMCRVPQQFTDFSESGKQSIRNLMNRLDNADIVVFDDIGRFKLSANVINAITPAVRDRLTYHKLSIFTSNHTDYRQLADNIGDYLAEIVWLSSNLYKFTGSSMRKVGKR